MYNCIIDDAKEHNQNIKVEKNKATWKLYFEEDLKRDTVKPVYNDHPRDPKIVAAVDRWSLFGGHLCNKRSYRDLKIVVVVDR